MMILMRYSIELKMRPTLPLFVLELLVKLNLLKGLRFGQEKGVLGHLINVSGEAYCENYLFCRPWYLPTAFENLFFG